MTVSLFIKAKIDDQEFEITGIVMGSSKASNITYTFYPTLLFLDNCDIICNSVEEDFAGNRKLCFYNSTDNFYGDVEVLEMRKVTLS